MMMTLRICLTLLLSVGLLPGCGNDDPAEPDPDPDEFEWITVLQGLEGWENLSGEAEVVWVDGESQFAATASVAGDEAGAVRPWHVHHNTCAGGGGIVGTDGDYPRLTIGQGGTATAAATVPVPMDVTGSFHVNIHLSEAEMGTIIACGDLNLIASN